MSTIVYQQQGNLQSCFEPQIFEITATLKLKVPPSPAPPCQDLGGWSILQSLTGIISKDAAAWEKEAAYVHPLARLSEKSLALCTEALGSETGTDMIESSSIFSSAALLASPAPTSRLASPEPTSRQEESLTSSQQIESRNVTSSAGAYRSMNHNSNRNSRNNNNFPPPLTTISGGANSLRVKPHREGGRLIIRAVETPSKRTYLQAERSNGRLRLSFFNADQSVDYPQITTSEESDVDVDDGEEFKEESDEIESDINGEDEVAEVQELEVDEEKEEEEEEGEEESDVYMARDMDGNTSNVEVEMGIKKCLLGRCKESGHSNKGLSQWREPKTLWVST